MDGDEDRVAGPRGGSLGLEEAALGAAYVRYRSRLVRLLARRLGEGAAEGAAQAVFLEAWLSRASYDPSRGSPWDWLQGIAGHVWHRRLARRQRRLQTEGEVVEEASPVGWARLDRATMLDLLQALEQLRPLNRRILILRFVEGYSNREIAEALALRENTVAKRIERTLAYLRERLTEL